MVWGDYRQAFIGPAMLPTVTAQAPEKDTHAPFDPSLTDDSEQ